MPKILKSEFFRRPALRVAPDLVGKYLVRDFGENKIERMITEVEAYIGTHDLASHSARGLTARNRAMYLPGGIWYVYFVYGMHWLLNIVTGNKDEAQAVLIRGVQGASGPGRVGKLFFINRGDYERPASSKSGLYIEDRGIVVDKNDIARSARVGVNYAGPIWSAKKYNFKLKSNA